MKYKNIILFTLTLFCGKAFSQTPIIAFSTPSDTIAFSTPLTDSSQVSQSYYVFVTNNSHSDTIGWRAIIVNEDSIWQLDYCNLLNCYTFGLGIPDNATHYFPADSASAYSTDFTAAPTCDSGTGELQILMWLQHDSAASARTLTFLPTYTGTCAVSGIQPTISSGYKIYPSPVNTELNIAGLSNLAEVKFKLFDIIGNTVMQTAYNEHADVVTLNTSNLNAGIYFLAIESGGKRVATKRVEKLN